MNRTVLSIAILLLLFAGTFATAFTSHSLENPVPRSVAQLIPAGDTRVGIDCGLGTTQAVVNGTGYPLAPSEVNPATAIAQTSCTWISDAGQTSTGANDGTTEPLVTDQDESLSLTSPSIGGGFTASVILIQNTTSAINGFDLQLAWNTAVLRAVEFDQQNIGVWTPNILLTPVKTIDNANGIAELAQVITGSAGGNFTLFRVRFDIIGVGSSQLHLVNVGGGLTSPGMVIHSTVDGAFDSETFFDPAHILNWTGQFYTTPTVPTPGAPLTFTANATCGGCTFPLSYNWDFSSVNTGPAKTDATGEKVTVTAPPVIINRVTLNITDAADHSTTITHRIPLAVAVQGTLSPGNVVFNPGFESSPGLGGWVADTYDNGNYYSTITANGTIVHSGTRAARMDISNNDTSIRLGTKTPLSHVDLIQYLPANTTFASLPDRPDGLSLWYYLQPKFAGAPAFEIRIRSGNLYEMDYVFENSSLGLSFFNSTTGSEGGRPLKQFLFPIPHLNQWNILERDLRRDWLTSMLLPNGTLAPGFPLSDTISRFEINAYFFKDLTTSNVYAETAWVDDVSILAPATVAVPVGTPTTLRGFWLGGTPPYAGSLRMCPGTTSNTICTLPNIGISGTDQNATKSVTYKLAGVYTDTLSISDSTPSFASATATQKVPLIVNVTGMPQAYTVSVTAPSTSTQGSSVPISASIVYNGAFPTTLESTMFTYTISYGDGGSGTISSGPTLSTSHIYSTAGNHTIRIIAQETGSTSRIQEVGYASVLIPTTTGFNYSLGVSPSQVSINSGQNASATVSIIVISYAQEMVALHAIYSINGVTITFSPSSRFVPFFSAMIIDSQPSTPHGSFNITIVGNSTSGVVRQTTLTLIIGLQSTGNPTIGVFSAHYGSANIVDTSLVAGSKFSVQVNVTNAPTTGWNGYEFALYYDQRYINLTSYDVNTNTVFPNPYVTPGTINSPGALRLSVVDLGSVNTPSGILVNITFTVVKAAGVSPLVLAAGMAQVGTGAGAPATLCPNCPNGAPNWSRLVSAGTLIGVQTQDGYFRNAQTGIGPVASFTYSPTSPVQGQSITFNATSSFDPESQNTSNHGILKYFWDFGDLSPTANATTTGPIVSHLFASGAISTPGFSGNFSIRLTVLDNDNGFEGMITIRLTIHLPGNHDIAVTSLTGMPTPVGQGQILMVTVVVSNLGTFTEAYNLTVFYGPSNATLPQIIGQTIAPGEVATWLFSVNTTNISLGTYSLTALASDKADTNPGNNVRAITFQVDELPIVSFTYSPPTPVVGQPVFFNATAVDPDGSIIQYAWNFGYGFSLFGVARPSAFFGAEGNYTVTVKVTDSDNLSASFSAVVNVGPAPVHDVHLVNVQVYPIVIISGQQVQITLVVENTGSGQSNFTATVYYNGKVAVTQAGLETYQSGSYFDYYYLNWNTAGVQPGNYTISATLFLQGDPTPIDNSFTDGQLVILPPPIITLTPSSGPSGTMVTVSGRGFPTQFSGPNSNEFLITFDNQFLGYSFAGNNFTFVFNVPVAQQGAHLIHAIELYPIFLDVSTNYTVTGSSGTLAITVTTGSIYFPGDSATIFVQTSLNGSPTTVTSIQAIILKPGNTNQTIKLTLLATGLYKTNYTIPSTGPILGTYAIIVKAHQTGVSDGQSLTTFEVKLSWIASQSKNITTAVAITGLVGVAAVAWRKGYFKRKDKKETPEQQQVDPFATL